MGAKFIHCIAVDPTDIFVKGTSGEVEKVVVNTARKEYSSVLYNWLYKKFEVGTDADLSFAVPSVSEYKNMFLAAYKNRYLQKEMHSKIVAELTGRRFQDYKDTVRKEVSNMSTFRECDNGKQYVLKSSDKPFRIILANTTVKSNVISKICSTMRNAIDPSVSPLLQGYLLTCTYVAGEDGGGSFIVWRLKLIFELWTDNKYVRDVPF